MRFQMSSKMRGMVRRKLRDIYVSDILYTVATGIYDRAGTSKNFVEREMYRATLDPIMRCAKTVMKIEERYYGKKRGNSAS